MKQQYKVGAYCRLSRDDENIGESGSITSQKEIIRQFCKQNELEITDYYQDDGFSGTNFQRPGFQRMLEDIEKGVINCVITKDLSRLGRDYIMAGYYTEVYFPEKNVRYIAINDGFDTLKGNSSGNDIAPFKNLLNDLYAKDISKKVRSSLQSKALNGEHGAAYAPIGYKKDPDVKNHLIIDEETAWVVKLIFEMCCNGKGCRQIRNYLQQNRILSPSALLHVRGQRYYGKQNFDTDEEALYRWSTDMVLRVLNNEVYIGNSVHYRNRKPNLKSKTKRQPKDSYLIIPNTHEPLIDEETWRAAKRKLASHVDGKRKHENIFVGIAKCADCGKSMSFGCKYYNGPLSQRSIRSLTCYTYTKYGKAKCTCHHTDYDSLCKLVLQRINKIIKMVQLDEQKVLTKLHKEKNIKTNSTNEGVKRKIASLEKRQTEIATVFAKLYEDRALSMITEDAYKMLSDKFQVEQQQNQADITRLKARITETIQTEDNIQSFMELIKSFNHIEELDADILSSLIDRIDIHNIQQDENDKCQQIDIYYKFIGLINFFN